ncbi:hypothetical protein ACFL0T_08450 [Candidatus Omnitrophota bacterium]
MKKDVLKELSDIFLKRNRSKLDKEQLWLLLAASSILILIIVTLFLVLVQ